MCELGGTVYCVCELWVYVDCVYFVAAWSMCVCVWILGVCVLCMCGGCECEDWVGVDCVWVCVCVGCIWVWVCERVVCVCMCGLWVACSTFWWMFHSHPFYYDPGQNTFMPVTASWSTKHGAIHGMKLATKPSKRRNNSLAGCVHNMADWIWKQMPAAGIVLVTEKTWPLRNRRQGGSPPEPRGRGEEVKPMNKSGHENRGEKKMLKRTFYGEKGAVQYAIALAPQLAEHFLRQWLFNRWET